MRNSSKLLKARTTSTTPRRLSEHRAWGMKHGASGMRHGVGGQQLEGPGSEAVLGKALA